MKVRIWMLGLFIFMLLASFMVPGASVLSMDPEEALLILQEGNERFRQGLMQRVDLLGQKDVSATEGQQPLAVVVSCSDSRVPPELIFDKGLGELFVVRTAGHVLEASAIGSIEYAVEHLGCRLVVILGHTQCGAVKAAIEGGEPTPNIAALVKAISPAVEYTLQLQLEPEQLAGATEDKHMQLTREYLLSESQLIKDLVKEGLVEVHLGKYDLMTGAVDWH